MAGKLHNYIGTYICRAGFPIVTRLPVFAGNGTPSRGNEWVGEL